MATLAEEIAALKAAIRRGVRQVDYDGRTVRYQSLAEMRSTLREMEREQAGQTKATHGGRYYLGYERGTE